MKTGTQKIISKTQGIADEKIPGRSEYLSGSIERVTMIPEEVCS